MRSSVNDMYAQEFFLNFSKHGMRARRIDWLLHILLGKVTNSYLQAQHAQDAGFSYSRALELQMELSVVYANRIPPESIPLASQPGEAAQVCSSSSSAVYTVLSPGTPEASCNCNFFMRGTAASTSSR